MLVEEGDLVGHDPLEGLLNVDREMPLGIHLHFTARSFGRVTQSRASGCYRVSFADAEQDWASDLLGAAARVVDDDLQPDAGDDFVAECGLIGLSCLG